MEGVYYEASATTPYHFMATAALDAPGNSSGAVRGITYRTQADFALGVRWLQVLGVRYLAVHSEQAKQHADADPRLTRVATSPDVDGVAPNGWSIYAVADTALVEPLKYRPVVVNRFDERDQRACRERLIQTGVDEKSLHLHEWQDCIGVPWFDDEAALDRPLVDEGPASWQRAGTSTARDQRKEAASARPRDRHPLRRRLDLVPRVAHRRARDGEGVVVPELGGGGRPRSVPCDAELHGGRAHAARRHPQLRDHARGVARSPRNARRASSGSGSSRGGRSAGAAEHVPRKRSKANRPEPDARPRQHLQGVRRARCLSRRDRRVGRPRRRQCVRRVHRRRRACSWAGTLDRRVRRSSRRSPRERWPPGPMSSTSGSPRPTWCTSRRVISMRPAPCSPRVTIPRSTRGSSCAARGAAPVGEDTGLRQIKATVAAGLLDAGRRAGSRRAT